MKSSSNNARASSRAAHPRPTVCCDIRPATDGLTEKADIWIPWYIGDYLADTQHMATIDHGAYCLLIMSYWRRGSLPDDRVALRHICRLTTRQFDAVWPKLSTFFVSHDGLLRHTKLDAQRHAWSNKKANFKQRAQKAATERWKQSGDASSIPQAMLEPCPLSSSSSSPNQSIHTHPPTRIERRAKR
jgi:uncharacterized protein YdaU (DUF1376 family)